jgi:hypothetical protein
MQLAAQQRAGVSCNASPWRMLFEIDSVRTGEARASQTLHMRVLAVNRLTEVYRRR